MSSGRKYTSTLRSERARETRVRIRRAAARLFASDGFTETTIAAIAEQAGVAAPTVYSVFGSKAGIVAAMLEEMDENADQEAWVGKILASPDAHQQARLFAGWLRALFEGGAPIIRAAIAARSDPDVAAMAERGDAGRRRGTRELVGIWARVGALRSGLDPEQAAEELWLLTSVEQYLIAVDRLGWSGDRYERWLADWIRRGLLTPTEPPN